MPKGSSVATLKKPKLKLTQALLTAESVSNPKISLLSNFLDDEWDFTKEMKNPSKARYNKCIHWGFKVKGDELFTAPKYYKIRTATKQLFQAMLRHTEEGPAQKPVTVIIRWHRIRPFIVYLVTLPRPILSFDEVTPTLISRYLRRLRKTQESTVSLYSYFRCLAIIFQYRRKMSSSLAFDPFATSSAGKEAGLSGAYASEHRTDCIPDAVLQDLIGPTVEYVNTWGPLILKASAIVNNIRQRAANKESYTTISFNIRSALKDFDHKISRTVDSPFNPPLSNLHKLHRARIRLRTACGILIAFVTGMRLSELLSIKAGCIQIEKSTDGDFIWLHSTLYKLQGNSAGIPAKWLGGPIALQAVAILEKLTKEVRRTSRCPYLLIPVTPTYKWNKKDPISDALDGTGCLGDFISFLGLKDAHGQTYYIHPHMFRRTFARHVVRCDSTNLLALKEHFKHCSVAMTDGYIGMDEELQDQLDQESDSLCLDSFDKALRSTRLSGRRGKELVTMVDNAIRDGRLPVEFRGEAGSHFRKKMIREFIDAGQRLYPCGASNFCWFRQDSADCTKGDRPVVESCNPVACANSVIDREEHGPFWENVVSEGESLLAMEPKNGPYRARLTSITRIAKKVVSDLES